MPALTEAELRMLREIGEEWAPATRRATGHSRQTLGILVSLGCIERREGLPAKYRLSDVGRAIVAEAREEPEG